MPSVCLNHTDRETDIRCTSCLKPICSECVQAKPEGRFCSPECYLNAVHHAKRVSVYKSQDRPAQRNILKEALQTIVLLVVLGAGCYWAWPHLPAEFRHAVLKLWPKM